MTLYFYGNISSSIAAGVPTTALEVARERISAVGTVLVTYSEVGTLCRSDVMNIVSITFVQNFCPLPPLVAETQGMEVSPVVEISCGNTNSMMTDDYGTHYFAIKGDKENDERSN